MLLTSSFVVYMATLLLLVGNSIADQNTKISVTYEITFPTNTQQNPPALKLNLKQPSTYGIDLLTEANENSNQCYHSNWTLGNYGAFVTTVCGVANNNTEGIYWSLYINDKFSDVGVSCLKLNNGDVMRLTYQKYNHSTAGSNVDTGLANLTYEVVFPSNKAKDPPVLPLSLTQPSTYGINLLTKANENSNQCYHSNWTLGNYGAFVTTVCGVANNNAKNKYWTLYINGEYATVGVSCLKLKDGDVMRFSYDQTGHPSVAIPEAKVNHYLLLALIGFYGYFFRL